MTKSGKRVCAVSIVIDGTHSAFRDTAYIERSIFQAKALNPNSAVALS